MDWLALVSTYCSLYIAMSCCLNAKELVYSSHVYDKCSNTSILHKVLSFCYTYTVTEFFFKASLLS